MKELMEFYPKLLLLGEYSILLGGHAITVPLRIYRASFDFLTHANRNPDAINSNTTLLNLANYFMHHEVISHNINIIRFLEDLENGLYLKSTIPMGYGIGSSGVVCAAILKTYPTDSLKPDFSPHGTYRLKTLLGAMESFFHGTSSGLDPLACYRD